MDDSELLLWGATYVESGKETLLSCCPSPGTTLSLEHRSCLKKNCWRGQIVALRASQTQSYVDYQVPADSYDPEGGH